MNKQHLQIMAAAEGLISTLPEKLRLELFERFTPPTPPPVASQEEQRLMKPAEFCVRAGISRSKLFDLLKSGNIRGVHLGSRTLRIPSSEIERLTRVEG